MFAAPAKDLAKALGFAAELAKGDSYARKIAGFEAISLAGTGAVVEVAGHIGDFHLVVSLPIAAMFERVAVPGQRLAGLIGGLPSDGMVEFSREGTMVRVSRGRARFVLPTIPTTDLPALLSLNEKVGQIELARTDAHRLFAWTAFAASTEETRYYMNGVNLRDRADGLAGIASDGHRLVRTILSGAGGFGDGVTVPNNAVRVVIKLLSERTIERVVMRCSRTLFELSGPGFTFTSKVLDAVFPDTDRVIPKPSGNTAVVDVGALMRAAACVKAVAGTESKAVPLVGLEWDGEPGVLHCSLAGWDVADDFIEAAEISGTGKVAVDADLLGEMLEEFRGKTIRLDGDGSKPQGTPLLLTDPKDPNYLALLSPCRWPLAASMEE